MAVPSLLTNNISNMKELTDEQRRRYSSAIRHGFLSVMNPQWHSFSGTWCRKHPNRVSTLVRLRDILGKNPDWDDLTDDVLSDLRENMMEEISPNSVRTICAELKAVLNRNKATKPIQSKTYTSILSVKKTITKNVYLTTSEIKRLHLYEPDTDLEKYVKAIFMRECLTGARCVDCHRFSMANVHEIDGVKYITYVAQKHPVEVSVPVHKWLEPYLADDWPDEYRSMRVDHLNERIKELCRKCGIDERTTVFSQGKSKTGKKYEFVTSHTGRRSFATNLFLRGCPLDQIAIMMGHVNGNTPNITMTANYICAKRSISKAVINLFN